MSDKEDIMDQVKGLLGEKTAEEKIEIGGPEKVTDEPGSLGFTEDGEKRFDGYLDEPIKSLDDVPSVVAKLVKKVAEQRKEEGGE